MDRHRQRTAQLLSPEELERRQKAAERLIYPMHSWLQNNLYYAMLPDLPGVMVIAESPHEAYRLLGKAKSRWIIQCLNEGGRVPLPNSKQRQQLSERQITNGRRKKTRLAKSV